MVELNLFICSSTHSHIIARQSRTKNAVKTAKINLPQMALTINVCKTVNHLTFISSRQYRMSMTYGQLQQVVQDFDAGRGSQESSRMRDHWNNTTICEIFNSAIMTSWYVWHYILYIIMSKLCQSSFTL